MSTLHLLNYNNYYNRIVKRESSLSGYQGYQVKYNGQATDPNGNTAVLQRVNFIDGDFVDTVQAVNWKGDIPNYILVVEDNVIKSRWFVVDSEKTRDGQLLLTLHRDLVVDFYDNLLSEDTRIFVEKATLPNTNDLIFNSENMTFNQIKTSEILLKDASECPWICIYAASRNSDGTYTSFDIDTGGSVPVSQIFESEAEFNAWTVKQAFDNNKLIAGGVAKLFSITARGVYSTSPSNAPSGWNPRTYTVSQTGDAVISEHANVSNSGQLRDLWTGKQFASKFQAKWDAIRTALTNYYSQTSFSNSIIYDDEAYREMSERVNQFVRVNTPTGAKYYKISVGIQEIVPVTFTPLTNSTSGAIYSAVKSVLEELFIEGSPTFNSQTYIDYIFNPGTLKRVSIEDVTDAVNLATTHVLANRFHLSDAPYDLFCMPFSDELEIKNSAASTFVNVSSNKQLAIDVARAFITKYSQAGTVYDAQILPYCPLTSTIISKSDGKVSMDLLDSSGESYTEITNDTGDTVGYLLHASVSSFTRQLELENPIIISDYKIESECDMYRLCSPNYNGIFEFNAAKNGGMTTINIQCTYKPYTPYIKLYPNWGRLYGSNFGDTNFDARGLICGGDFSLPATTSAWTTYELQNKNYQNSFDRQIQNLEINNAVQREQENWSIAAGALQAAGNGAGTGLLVGGPVGAIIGGAVGGAVSAAGGARDKALNEKLRRETIDYTKDQFGYQLGNIKALPESISKVSAYNIDNKYFPFLEYYTCSEVEKQALRDKIKYNGMTVMAIGSMIDYVANYNGEEPQYFKGKLIRLADFTGDYHILNAIANEIYMGVFI